MSDIAALTRRLERTEARQAIAELPCRYALAVDSRDLDAWLSLFVADVDCGRRGKGREALRSFIEPNLRTFYRSIHQICGHIVEFIDDETAKGTVYCRAEHEEGGRWIAMAIVYFDQYVRRDGQWYFARRVEKHWYSADILERPAPPFQLWDTWSDRVPHLPGDFATWHNFWRNMDPAALAKLTGQP